MGGRRAQPDPSPSCCTPTLGRSTADPETEEPRQQRGNQEARKCFVFEPEETPSLFLIPHSLINVGGFYFEISFPVIRNILVVNFLLLFL